MAYQKQEKYTCTEELAVHFEQILQILGEDTSREGLLKTPARASKAMQFLTQGYGQSATEILQSALFKSENHNMVLVKDIPFFSLCEHHLLPFFGTAHIAYFPNEYMVGLSKIPRTVDVFARRLQVQEQLTTQIRDAIDSALSAKGVAVALQASHLCMQMRGVQKTGGQTLTMAFSGDFETSNEHRQAFLQQIKF
jgi:GTP cyclohydrolase IA